MTRHYLKPISPPWWIALSLCLHLALLAWCPSPTFTSPPLPTYLVVDLFSGSATSGTGNSLDDSSSGGDKTARSAKNTSKSTQPPTSHTTPQRQLESHQHQQPTKPAKKQSTDQPKQKATKPLPEEPQTAATLAKTEIAPSLVVTAESHRGRGNNADIYQETIKNGGSNGDSTPNEISSYGTGADNSSDSGSGKGTGSGRGGQAGSGSPVETPFAYGSNPPPPYPKTARRRGWEGEVLLLVEVSAVGEVRKITVSHSSGYSILDRAAINAVYRWRFQAALRNGRAVAGKVMVPIQFSIKDAK